MDYAGMAVVVSLASLAMCVVFLSFRLVNANRQLADFANRALGHAFAHDDAQQAYMRSQLELEQAELLLREKRDAARTHRVPPQSPTGNDFDVPLQNGVMT